jgi:hypothetical protein
MRFTLASIALLSGVALSLPSLAATVEPVEGQVSINRGNGFQRVAGAVQANVGDSVMASPNGSARIVYSDGCSVPVVPQGVITITAESPCKAFAQATPSGESPGLTPGQQFGVAAAIVVGTVGGVVAAISGNKGTDAPASP